MNITLIEKCRICKNEDLEIIKEFNQLPVAGLYYDEDELDSIIKMPMTIERCTNCGHVQLKEVVDSRVYKEYSYAGTFSETYVKHLDWVSKYFVDNYNVKNKKIIEIGSSNGYFIHKLRDDGNNDVFGYEPSEKLTEEAFNKYKIRSSNDFFSESVISKSCFDKVDVFIIRHVLEHINDFETIFNGINKCISENGILLVEVPSLESTIENKLYSNFFHEHVNYFSETTITKLVNSYSFKLEEKICVDIHGGSVLLIFKKTDKIANNFDIKLREVKNEVLKNFFAEMDKYNDSVYKILLNEKKQGNKIFGFGASHRTAMILSTAGISNEIIEGLYDSNIFLTSKYIIGNIKIEPTENFVKSEADTIVIFAMSFENEIIEYIKKINNKGIKIISLKDYPHYI